MLLRVFNTSDESEVFYGQLIFDNLSTFNELQALNVKVFEVIKLENFMLLSEIILPCH